MESFSSKWGGGPHYRGVVEHLGDDEHGSWLWRLAGTPIYRGDEVSFDTDYPSLMLVVPGAWWTPSWWFGHPTVALYVNINTPVEREGDRWSSIDLDLDVVRWTDGRTEIVDRDELDDHRVQLGYPDDLVASIEDAAQRAHDLVVATVPPFDGVAAEAWRARAEA